jgi:4-methylaminobutanoate oxidase (formaldehyde-forming)
MLRPPGRAIYTMLLNERGGIESDMTVLRLAEDHYRLYTGTAAIRHDIGWIRRFANDMDVTIRDVSTQYAVLALMGPNAPDVLQRVGADNLNSLSYFGVATTEIAGVPAQAARLTYVGEAGMEITCAADHADQLYQALTQGGAGVAGLFAQTAMRIEKRYLAYGHDMDAATSPIQAGLGFAVHWDRPFHGRDALLRRRDAGECCRLVSLVFEDGQAVPIGDEPVYRNNEIIGKTTSAAFGHRVGAPVALAELTEHTPLEDGLVVRVQVGAQYHDAVAYNRAVFDPGNERIRRAIRS